MNKIILISVLGIGSAYFLIKKNNILEIKKEEIKKEEILIKKDEILKDEILKDEIIQKQILKDEILKEEILKEEIIQEEIIQGESLKKEEEEKVFILGPYGEIFISEDKKNEFLNEFLNLDLVI